MKAHALSIAVLTAICLSKAPAFGMAGDAHNDLSAKLLASPPSEGGAAGMRQYKLEQIQRWMDNPATKTGEYMNRTTGTIIHPTNHGHLRHNPEAVSRALSGTGEIDPAVENIARLHKIADVSHNSAPVDGWEITSEMRQEAKSIVAYVEKRSRLPKNLPRWVDESGPIMETAAQEGRQTAGAARNAGTSVARATEETEEGVVRGLQAGTRAASKASKAAKIVGKVAVPIAVAVEVGVRGKDVYDTEVSYRAAQISSEERWKRHGTNGGSAVGGVVGAWAGAETGAAVGGAIGALVGPEGAPVGALIGGGVGAIAGGFGGDAAGGVIGGEVGSRLGR